MFVLKLFLAIVGLGIIVLAVVGYLTEITQELGLFAGLFGAAIMFFVFGSDRVVEFLGISSGLVDDIGFGAMVGGGILCTMDIRKIGGVMVTAGWVAAGLLLIQAIPIPVIAGFIEMITLPFTVACIPLLLLILFFISL